VKRNARGSGASAGRATTREGAARGGARGGARGAAAREAARPRTAGRQARQRQDAAEERYDLLTAALIGAAVGATAMLLVRRPAKRQVLGSLADLGVAKAGRMALKAGANAGRSTGPMMRDAAENLGDYIRTARGAIDEFLADEVRDIKKAIRRGRRRAGL
jgi:hypothetical protein